MQGTITKDHPPSIAMLAQGVHCTLKERQCKGPPPPPSACKHNRKGYKPPFSTPTTQKQPRTLNALKRSSSGSSSAAPATPSPARLAAS